MASEQIFHWVVWTLSIIYALVRFSKSCENYPSLNPYDFKEGWSFLDRMKDGSDEEWSVLTATFKSYWPLLVYQVVCSAFIRKIKPKAVIYFYASYSIYCLVHIVGYQTTYLFLLYITLNFAVHYTGSISLCYVFSISTLLFLHGSYFKSYKDFFCTTDNDSFLFDVGFAWLMAKGLSFSVDRIRSGHHKSVSSVDIAAVFSYCMYIPTVFTGPIIIYDHFAVQVHKSVHPSLKKFMSNSLHLLYLLLLYIVYELLLHFIYSSAIQYSPDVVSTFDGWSLCGLGYALPMMFYLKYFIIYGVAGSLANLNDVKLPPPPMCISVMHVSSFLWRHFDRGLYLWLLKYFYHPLMGSHWNFQRKVIALALSYAFVSLWHGFDIAVCVWCFLNFALLLSENAGRFLDFPSIRKNFKKLPYAVQKRISAAFATPHFLIMCLSCTFFLSNWDIGMLLSRRILFGGVTPLVPLAFIMYCGCHVSMNSKKWQARKSSFCRMYIE